MTHWQHNILETTWRNSFPECFLRACAGLRSAQRAINNICSSLGVPARGIPLRHTYAKHAFYDAWKQVYRWLHYSPLRWNPREHPHYFIFLENKLAGLHIAADNIGLSLLKFFWWAPEFLFTLARGAFRPFKGIQGHWHWCQSKACMRLPISP